jgi:hypothetical protein
MSKKKRAAKEERKIELAELRHQRAREMYKTNPDVRDNVDMLLRQFREKFGREAGPGDPLMFDPSKDVPTPLPSGTIAGQMIAAMFRASLPPELIYAYSKSGVVVTEHNRDVVDPDDLAAWNAAADEFLSLEPAEQAATLQAIRTREVQ